MFISHGERKQLNLPNVNYVAIWLEVSLKLTFLVTL